jgi:hypothetical protein
MELPPPSNPLPPMIEPLKLLRLFCDQTSVLSSFPVATDDEPRPLGWLKARLRDAELAVSFFKRMFGLKPMFPE